MGHELILQDRAARREARRERRDLDAARYAAERADIEAIRREEKKAPARLAKAERDEAKRVKAEQDAKDAADAARLQPLIDAAVKKALESKS